MKFTYGKRSQGIRYRQLARLAEFGTDNAIGNDALKQLNRATILHLDIALQKLEWDCTALAKGVCPMCCNRHWRKPFIGIGRNQVMTYCCYGIRYGLTHLLSNAWLAAMHGED